MNLLSILQHKEKSRCRSNRYKVLCKKFIKYRENGRKLRCKNELIQKGMEGASKFQMEQSNFDNRESTSTGTRKVIGVKDITKSRFYAVLQHKKIRYKQKFKRIMTSMIQILLMIRIYIVCMMRLVLMSKGKSRSIEDEEST